MYDFLALLTCVVGAIGGVLGVNADSRGLSPSPYYAVAAVDRQLGLGLGARRIGAALAVSAVTHYVADRSGGRWQEKGPSTRLVRLARRTGHSGWLKRDPGAGLLLDQAWHRGWIAVAAAIAAAGRADQ